MKIRKSRFGIRLGLAAAIVCWFWGWARGMQYEPFRFCLETAKVDSSRTWIWLDEGFGVPPPYKEVRSFQYQPGSCIPKKTVGVYDYADKPEVKTYSPRPGGRAVDYTHKFEDGVTATGTEYYSAAGTLDSSYYHEKVVDEDFTFTRVQRFVTTPQYELVKTYYAFDDEPLEFSQGDSIVANDSGKTVYSKGDYENRVTECVTRGKTFVCTPTQIKDMEDKLKIIWFLDQGRPDSMQVFLIDGTLFYTRTYFWSSRQGSNVQVRHPGRAIPRAMESPRVHFDLRGRRLDDGHGMMGTPSSLVPGIFPFRD